MIYVYTGNGKGKTTAAIGQIIRAAGKNFKICLIQLFKDKKFYSEQKILQKLKNIDFYAFAPKHPFCFPKINHETVKKQCEDAINFVETILTKKKYDLVVLEEFNIAIRDEFICVKKLIDLLEQVSPKMHVIITGRGACKELIDKADLVTEMKEIKHPFKKGIRAIKGIEF